MGGFGKEHPAWVRALIFNEKYELEHITILSLLFSNDLDGSKLVPVHEFSV